jgi:hypothetical protein
MHIILGNSNLLISVLLLLPALYPNFPVAKRLQSTGPIIAPRVESGEMKIVAAYYGLDTGQIELLKLEKRRSICAS